MSVRQKPKKLPICLPEKPEAVKPLFFRETHGGLPVNPIQRKCFTALRKEGYEVARRAFPHFAAYNPKTGRLVLVICRNVRGRQTRKDQRNLAALLMQMGVEVLYFHADKGFRHMKLVNARPVFELPPAPVRRPAVAFDPDED